MKVPLLKASFAGNKKDLNRVIKGLKETASFQKTIYKKADRTEQAIDCDEYDRFVNLEKRLKNALNFAKIKDFDATDFVNAPPHDEVIEIVKKLELLQGDLLHIENTLKYNEDTIRELHEYANLPIPFNMVESTRSVSILCGVMPVKKFGQFERDFNNQNFHIESFPSGKTNRVVVVTSHKDHSAIADVIHSYDFIPCRFTFDTTALKQIAILEKNNIELKARREQDFEQSHLYTEEATMLKSYYNFVVDEIDTMDLIATTLQTQKYYVLNGWIIESEIQKVHDLLLDISPDISVTYEQADKDDEVPVLLKNNPVVAPFRTVTNMYGVPGGKDIDPNPFVAIFYFLFFGMMIGDVGYAIVLATAVFAFIYFKKPKAGTRQFLLLFGICSISAIAWGLFFGSAFGFDTGTAVIDPLESAIYVLLLALLLGLFQMCTGVILDVYTKISNKSYLQAVLKGVPRVILFIGLIIFLPALAFDMFNLQEVPFFTHISPIGMWITIVGASATALSNPYALVSYFNDVISYVRLFALALVGTVIAMVGNQIGGMMFDTIPVIGYIFGVIIAIAFHVFNLGLGLLGAYIHGARLQFIEFFSKFYTGDGREFRPIGKGGK